MDQEVGRAFLAWVWVIAVVVVVGLIILRSRRTGRPGSVGLAVTFVIGLWLIAVPLLQGFDQ